jgi:hypothetical protein
MAINPGGNLPRSLSAAGMSPVCTSETILSWRVVPIPASSVARPSSARAATDKDASLTALAALR